MLIVRCQYPAAGVQPGDRSVKLFGSVHLDCDPATELLGICPTEMQARVQSKLTGAGLRAILSVMTPKQEQQRGPSIVERSAGQQQLEGTALLQAAQWDPQTLQGTKHNPHQKAHSHN